MNQLSKFRLNAPSVWSLRAKYDENLPITELMGKELGMKVDLDQILQDWSLPSEQVYAQIEEWYKKQLVYKNTKLGKALR